MSAFKFRLEKVLNVKQIFEEQAKQEWAIQERLAHQERFQLQYLREQKQDIISFGHNHEDFKIRQATYSYLAVLEDRIEKQIIRIQRQEEKAHEAKQKWLLARQDTEKITKLKEQDYEIYVKEELRKEQRVLDDMKSFLD
ncbi:MAG: flagellar FliJ family protein [Bacillota bacterium]|nr:flagellar FliJ family protein [Bacillota bacterium]HHU61309.1 hypothetical protein [Natronincola sp.]